MASLSLYYLHKCSPIKVKCRIILSLCGIWFMNSEYGRRKENRLYGEKAVLLLGHTVQLYLEIALNNIIPQHSSVSLTSLHLCPSVYLFFLSPFCYCVSDQRARVPYTLLFDSVSLDRRPGHGCRITWFLEAKQFDFSNIFVNICTCRQTNSEQVFIPHARAAYNKKPYIERTMMTGDETKVSTLHGYMIWLPRR